MNRYLNVLLVVFILLTLAAKEGKLFGEKFPPDKSIKEEDIQVEHPAVLSEIQSIFPEVREVRDVDTAWMEVYGSNHQKLGEVLLSSPYSDKIIGYNGATPLLIALDISGKIASVKLLDNNESPSYVRHAENAGLLDSWTGLSLSDALAKKVDAVSGATYTSTAVIKSLNERLAVAVNVQSTSRISWSMVVKHTVVLLILALALYSFFYPARAKKFRIVLLVLSVVVLGFWQGSMLSLAQFLSWLTNGMSVGAQLSILVLLALAVLLPIFTGKAFHCTYVCPFGAMQELAGKLNKKKISLKQSLVKWLVVIRKAFLVAVVLLLIIGVEIDLVFVEPFSAFNLSAAPWIAIGIAVVSLVLSVFITKPWCRFLCPTGQALDLLKKPHVEKKQS